MSQPLENEIMRILLEAGEENLPTVMNTLREGHTDAPPETLLAEAEASLQALERQGYIELCWYREGWVPLTTEERRKILPLVQSLVWNSATGHWQWNEAELGRERPLAVLTDAGQRHIRGVLRQG